MELQCTKCGEPTAVHCSNTDCLWTVCAVKDCGWIYSTDSSIPSWERYARGQDATS